MAQYQALIKRAQGVSQGPTQAGATGLQNQAFGAYGAIPGQYEGNALDAAGRAGAPIDAAGIQRYENPYQQDVINATMGNLRETDAQQSNQVKGNAISQGAFGGSREAVAQAELARQQGLANGQTLAGLNAGNYGQALNAAQADRDAAARSAGLYGGLEANAAGVAGQQLGAGSEQRGINQSLLTQPYQQAQWLAGIEGAVGPQEGTTTTGTQTTPAPTLIQQLAGLGIAGAGVAGGLGWKPFGAKRGGRAGYAEGGGVPRPSSRAHEMMQHAIELAATMRGSAYGGAVNPGIGVRGYDDGGGVGFPSWMFDPSQTTGGGFSPMAGPDFGRDPSSATYIPPLANPGMAKDQGRVPQGALAPAMAFGDTGDGGPVDVTGLGEPFRGAPPPNMVAGISGGPSSGVIGTGPKTGIAGTSGGPGTGIGGGKADVGVPPQFQPSATAAASKAASQGAPEWSLPLIAAGLGILASRSPNLGVALGEGGLQGVQQLNAQRKTEFDRAMAQRDYELKAQQLSQQASQFQQNLGLETQKTAFEVAKPFAIGVDEMGRTQYGVRGPDGTIQTVAGNLPGSSGTGTPIDATTAANKYNLVLDDDQATRFSQVPDALKPMVAGLLNGTQAISDIPGGVRSPMRINAINAARGVDPSYDEVAAKAGQTFETARSTQQFMANAKTAGNTVDELMKLSDKIDRGNITFLNNGLMALKGAVSDPDTKRFVTLYNLSGDELGKILGSGQGSDFAIQLGRSLVDITGSKESVRAQGEELKRRLYNKMAEYKSEFRQGRTPSVTDEGKTATGPSGKTLPPDVADKVARAKAAGRTEAEIAAALKADGY